LKKPITYSILILLIAFSCSEVGEEEKTIATQSAQIQAIPEIIDFSLHVKPILSDRCFVCHGPDKAAVKGNLSLHTAEGAYAALGENLDRHAIVPGDVEKSQLVSRIFSTSKTDMMPPPESNLLLEPHEKEILKKWVEQGAEYKKHWAFVTPQPQNVPEIENDNWSKTAIDKFVLAKLQEKNYAPSSIATPEKLLRRVTFDLTGLPPSPEKLAEFCANPSDEHLEQLVDSMLLFSDHAELMAAEWMDVARYADTHGYQDDFERTMWPWRDWVIHAFRTNMPYDQFVKMQLAGDLMPGATKEHILATGFNRNHKITAEGGSIPEEFRVEYVEDRTNTFGTAFLGLTMECARCHDHKYDPISQKEHFQLFSFFNNVEEQGLVEMYDMAPEPTITITPSEVASLLSYVNLKAHNEDEVKVMVMSEMSTPRQAHVLGRGSYENKDEEVFPDMPEWLLAYPEDLPKNRLGLAEWLFHPDNPLTARVTVNRIWQKFFGQGIVKTSYDFGNQGSLPSHPELLDYLALDLQENDWNLNQLIKTIVLSAAYQQSTETTEQLRTEDPENKYLARASRLRLSGEAIRDQALAISGLLNKEIGGPSVKPYQPAGIWEETTGGGGGSTATYVQSQGKDLYRKSMYTFWKRTVPPPSMLTFDSPTRDLCTVKRSETNTPLQALVMLNDPQIIEAARATAVRCNAKHSSLQDQITHVFQLATSRNPTEQEIQTLKELHSDMEKQISSGEIVIKEYLSIGEYEVPEEEQTEELTALCLLVHAIFNLDEVINRG